MHQAGLRPVQHAAAAIAAVAFGALAFAGVDSSPAGESPGCGPAGARTYAENGYVRVYRRNARKPMYACSKRTGARVQLDAPSSDDTAFPTVAVHRWWVVYAHTQVDTTVDVDAVYTRVELLDGRSFERGYDASLVRSVSADRQDPAKVGSIVVNAKGSFAWISCRSDEARARPEPECVRPGSFDRVWRRDATHVKRLLDQGRRIDPKSLRLRGTRIRWLDGGEWQKAKLE